MTLHMIPEFDRGFMRHLTNVFLIRHPARVVASYAKKREAPTLPRHRLCPAGRTVSIRSPDWTGATPIVIDSADIRANPRESLKKLCTALGHPLHRNHAALARRPQTL